MSRIICLIGFASLMFFVGCRQSGTSDPGAVETAAYYWRTSLEFDTLDRRVADDIGLKIMYIRLFDVDWSEQFGEAVPVGNLSNHYSAKFDGYALVPTVYITQEVLEHLDEAGLDSLAGRMWGRIRAQKRSLAQTAHYAWLERQPKAYLDTMDAQHGYTWRDSLAGLYETANITELQMDCDWTKTTREKYFHFLKTMKRISGMKLSCTLRLHQFADRDVLPPVDRVMLMAYNVSNIRQRHIENAILSPEKANAYLKGGAYPLPMDMALPVFSWGACYRGGKYVGLLRDLWTTDVKDNPTFYGLGQNRFRLTRDTVMGEMFLRIGDELRIDEPSDKILETTARYIRSNAGFRAGRITFFDWNTSKINTYAPVIKNIVAASR